MDVSVARWLVSREALPWLDRAAAEPDPSSLGAATRWRRELEPDRAAAVLDQVALRRRAGAKLGEWAPRVFLTREGLEMATRRDVARWRAARLAGLGVTAVVDVGLGLGIDSMAFAEAGLSVTGIERDPVAAVLGEANVRLMGEVEVVCGEWDQGAVPVVARTQASTRGRVRAERREGPFRWPLARPLDSATSRRMTGEGSCGMTGAEIAGPVETTRTQASMAGGGRGETSPSVRDTAGGGRGETSPSIRDTALFFDPSRRTGAGRSWDVADLSPPWPVVEEALRAWDGPVVAKLGPGFPRRLIPGDLERVWVSHHGDLVELSLWGKTGDAPVSRALLLPSGDTIEGVGVSRSRALPLPSGDVIEQGGAPGTGTVGRFVWEPDPAVSRADAWGAVAERIGARMLDERIGYLTGDEDVTTPFAERFLVDDVLDFDDKAVRAWARANGVGVLEIKTRGLDLDPAAWRRRLRLKGSVAATVIVAPTGEGARVLVVRRG